VTEVQHFLREGSPAADPPTTPTAAPAGPPAYAPAGPPAYAPAGPPAYAPAAAPAHAAGAGAGAGDASGRAGPDRADAAASPGAAGEVTVFALADIAPRARLWGWSRIVLGSAALRGVPGLRFAKVLGSGADGGFGLRPSPSIQALFCVFADDDAAAAFTGAAGALNAWRERSRECFSVRLRPYASRGTWSGARLEAHAVAPAAGPIAALTRASIRPTRAAAFWRMQPPAERSLADRPGCLMAAGVGEAPVLRQATFSVWSDTASMDAYARSGAHQDAIRAAARGGFFSESMFVRFVPYDAQGTWKGRALAC
jgi:hypothetical protein